MRIYIKIKQWILRAQSHNLNKSQLCGARVFGAKAGDTVMVDGFTTPKMTSKSWYKARFKDSQSTVGKLPSLREETARRKPINPLAISQWDSLKLPCWQMQIHSLNYKDINNSIRKILLPQLVKKKSSSKIPISPKSPSPQFPEWAIHTHLFTRQRPKLTFYSNPPLRVSRSTVVRLEGRTPSTAQPWPGIVFLFKHARANL